VLLITLIILGLRFLKKRKQRPQYTHPPELAHDKLATKYEMYHDGAAKHEMPATVVVEVPTNERPAELPSYMPDNVRKHP
jgi:hypothetical protein